MVGTWREIIFDNQLGGALKYFLGGRGHFQRKNRSGLSVIKKRIMQMVDALGVYNLPVPIWFQMPGDIF